MKNNGPMHIVPFLHYLGFAIIWKCGKSQIFNFWLNILLQTLKTNVENEIFWNTSTKKEHKVTSRLFICDTLTPVVEENQLFSMFYMYKVADERCLVRIDNTEANLNFIKWKKSIKQGVVLRRCFCATLRLMECFRVTNGFLAISLS